LLAALLLAWLHREPDNLAGALEKCISSVQVNQTASTLHGAKLLYH
jgi:hypothetical protein